MSADFRIIGQPRPQLEGLAKVTGQAAYTHDLTLPDMLYGVILRSPHPHARIKSVDLSKAHAMPGVVAAVSGRDFPDKKYINAGAFYADRFAMARDRVRFVGEEVAAVAAETLTQAQAALAAIAQNNCRCDCQTALRFDLKPRNAATKSMLAFSCRNIKSSQLSSRPINRTRSLTL